MKIGRKIYYEKLTGNILQDCGEREGSVIETTLEQDFSSYVSLAERVPSTVGVIQLTYRQYADKFNIYHYSIDIATNKIVWGELIDSGISVPRSANQEIVDNQITLMNKLTTIYTDIQYLKEVRL